MVAQEIPRGDAAVGEGAETPPQQVSQLGHPLWGRNSRICLQLEER